jgi:hypothetical protein
MSLLVFASPAGEPSGSTSDATRMSFWEMECAAGIAGGRTAWNCTNSAAIAKIMKGSPVSPNTQKKSTGGTNRTPAAKVCIVCILWLNRVFQSGNSGQRMLAEGQPLTKKG